MQAVRVWFPSSARATCNIQIVYWWPFLLKLRKHYLHHIWKYMLMVQTTDCKKWEWSLVNYLWIGTPGRHVTMLEFSPEKNKARCFINCSSRVRCGNTWFKLFNRWVVFPFAISEDVLVNREKCPWSFSFSIQPQFERMRCSSKDALEWWKIKNSKKI